MKEEERAKDEREVWGRDKDREREEEEQSRLSSLVT